MDTADITAIEQIVGPDGLSTDPEDLTAYARDLWPRGLILARGGRPADTPPEAIAWPQSTAEAQALVRLCNERKIPFVPFGAGSGVCGGTLALRGGLCIDTKRMRRLLWTDAEAGLARVECGVVGEVLEEALARRGLTLGHFPSSIYCSTLGGFLAARSAGQMSTRYGKIEDMVVSAEVILPGGEVAEVGLSRPDLLSALVGAEGTLGLFTRATLRVHRAPEVRRLRGLRFRRVSAGLEVIREILQAGLRPSVVRLYDEIDTLIALTGKNHGKAEPADEERSGILEAIKARIPRGRIEQAAWAMALRVVPSMGPLAELGPKLLRAGCLLILAFEGEPSLAEAEEAAALEIAARHEAEDLGPGPGERWLEKRYAISYKLSRVFNAGAFADTMEVAAPWDRLETLYEAVREALQREAVVMAHFSHAYHEGCSIYFSFGSSAKTLEDTLARYDRIWQKALDAVLAVGAASSHHHGIGLLKAGHLRRELGPGGALLDALKAGLDPAGLSNPGKLGFRP